MAPRTVPQTALAVLMALRVKGRAGAAAVAAAAGLTEAEARVALAEARARGAARSGARPEDLALTAAGREELTALLAAEAIDRDALAAAYDDFTTADATLKARVTEWQRRAPEGRAGAARASVSAAGADACALAARLARIVPRLAPYARRLAAAAHAFAAGDDRFVASPVADSLHQVWFELHEDLLATLGRGRAS